MRERVFSLETEYAPMFAPAPDAASVESEPILNALQKEMVSRAGTPASQYLLNGSRFYPDVGHAEWSLPECRSAREAAVYDRAADITLAEIAPAAVRHLGKAHAGGAILLVKNNVDAEGNTYGCHENYLTEGETVWLSREDQLRLTIRHLVPFLVTRQILCGTGRVGWGDGLQEGVRFQIGQRSDFIQAVASKDTRAGRANINLGREEESLGRKVDRRLHLILGDANMSPWATCLKLGTVGLLLRQIEDLRIGDVPMLMDPVAALRTISRDPRCRARVPLRAGGEASAIEIQRVYHRQTEAYLAEVGGSAEEERILYEWGEALRTLEQDPAELCFKADWVTKQMLLDRFLAREGVTWDDAARNPRVRAALQRMDIEYHVLGGAGLYGRLAKTKHDEWVSPDEARRAAAEPPPHTRARIRGDVVSAARRAGFHIDVKWESIEIGGQTISLPDPLAFFDHEVFAKFGHRGGPD